MSEIEYEVVWSQTMETADAKAVVRQPPPVRRAPDTNEIVAFFVETHQDCTMKSICAHTGLDPQRVGDALFRLKRSGRVTSSHPQYEVPRRPGTWRVIE